MSEKGRELVERMHREAMERDREEKRRGSELVETMFREAWERELERRKQEQAWVEQFHREALERYLLNPPPGDPPKGIHYAELPPANPGESLAEEWNTYRGQVGRWLAEGHEGRHVLIKGEEVIGIYDTWEEAREVGLNRYLLEPFFVHPIRAEEPHLRIRGINYPWPNSGSRLPVPA
jgi:hypothetical protein